MNRGDQSKLSLRAIEVFVAIVEERGVTPAAKRLGASPSAVSLQLSNLEAALGVRLIERSAQRFALTPAGEQFQPRALRVLDEISGARASLSGAKGSPRMTLRIAVIEDFDSSVMAPWLAAINKRHPNIRFNVKSGPSHESHEALSNRSADIIVAVEAVDTAEWVEEHPILNDPYLLFHASKLRKHPDLEQLQEAPFIRYSREQLMGRQISAHLRRNKISPQMENEFSSNEMLFAMVREREGWTLSSTAAFLSVAGNMPEIIPAKLPVPAFSRRISLYARKHALGQLPGELADLLRSTLENSLIGPAREVARLEGLLQGFETIDDNAVL